MAPARYEGMDPELVSRAQRGDQRAFEHRTLDAYHRLHTLAHGILASRSGSTIWRGTSSISAMRSVGTVNSRLHRAQAALRASLEADGRAPSRPAVPEAT